MPACVIGRLPSHGGDPAAAGSHRPGHHVHGHAGPLLAGFTAVSSKLVIVSASERIQDQLRMTGVTDMIGPDNIYPTDERVGATLKRAYADAQRWIQDQPA